MNESRRDDDRLIGQLIEKIDSHIAQCSIRDQESQDWRKSVDKRLVPVEQWLLTANTSWKLVIGTITMTGAIFKAIGLVRAHWH